MIKEISIRGGPCRGGWIKTTRCEFKYCVDLFPCDVELFDDFLDGRSGFEVFEHSGHGHPGVAKHPCAA
jgi:hypothetical protein